MTQPDLFTAPPSTSLCAKLADYFKAREGRWVDAHELLSVAGFAAWRTRLSELRRAPYGMQIVNRTYRRNGLTVSEYKFVKAAAEHAA